jgi:hypothetical protein
VHLYTLDTFLELIERAGFSITSDDATVIPIEKLAEAIPTLRSATSILDTIQYRFAKKWPELFAYQFVVQAQVTGPPPAPVRRI